MRCLVTGGAGFIGSHVVETLVAAGHDVVVVDRVLPSNPVPGVEHVVGDVADRSIWDDALAGPFDAVCHQAARVGLGVDFQDAPAYAHDNDVGTAVLLAALDRHGFAGRIVLASSMVVYGEGRYRCATDGVVRPRPREADRLAAGHFEATCPRCGSPLIAEAITEDDALDPRNVYAATKLHQEHLAAVWAREVGGTVVALRYHNVYGPRMPTDTPYAGVAAIFASAVARGESPRVFEDGGQTRDFVHVRDVARANMAALMGTDMQPFEAFNVASGRPRTVLELAETIAAGSAAGVPPQVTGEWRLGDVRHVFASPARALDRLGWRADEPFQPTCVLATTSR